MKKFKDGQRVTAKAYYMPRRVYGRILGIVRRGTYAVRGNFGLEEFHIRNIRAVR